MKETTSASSEPRIVHNGRRLWHALAARRPFSWIMQRPWFPQLFRFALVGVANTAVYYGFYWILLWTGLYYLASHIIAWILSFIFSFYVNCYFTYRVKPTWARFVKFPLGAAVNLGFTTFGTAFFVEIVGLSEVISPLIAGILAIPFTYVATTLALKGLRKPTSDGSDDVDIQR